MTWGDGFYVTYDHLVTGEVSAIRENGAGSGIGVLASYAYDDLGRRTGLTRGNGTVTGYGYDTGSELTALTQDLAGTGYDTTTTLAYTPAGQIASLARSNDAYAWTGAANTNTATTVNGLNQATSVGAGSLAYDGRGNLTTASGGSYTYTVDNLLATAPGGSYVYDSLDRIFYATAPNSLFRYDGGELIAEQDATYGTVQRRYVFGPGSDEPLVWYEGTGTADRHWIHADERGSVVATTNDSGAATAIDSYDEYGVPASGNVGRFQYTGQAWLPELGMYYYKARIYAPTLGRFLQTDPIGYGDGMNWYNYVGSDPLNAIDPTGTEEGGIVVTGHRLPPPCEGICISGDAIQNFLDQFSRPFSDIPQDEIVVTGAVNCKKHPSDKRCGGPQMVPCPSWSGQRTPVSAPGTLTQEEIGILFPIKATSAYNIGREAISATQARYPGVVATNNEADAYRHFYWSFLMTRVLGQYFSGLVGTSHEISRPDTEAAHYMDYYNNAIARWAAQDSHFSGMTPDQAARAAIAARCLITSA